VLKDIKTVCILMLVWQREMYPEPAGQDDIYTARRRVNYIVAKGYHHINLLSFMQKTIQRVVATNIRDETLGHVAYIYNNLPTYQGSPQKLQCTMWIHIYRKQWKTRFPRHSGRF